MSCGAPTSSERFGPACFALVVGFALKYDKNAGVGTVVSLMLPYVVITLVLWTLLFIIWYLLGLP